MKKQIRLLLSPSLQCVEKVYEEMQKIMQFCVQQVSIGTRSGWEESRSGVGGVTLRGGRSHTRGVGGITLRGWVESHSVMPVSTNHCAPKTQHILPSLLVSGEGVPALPPASRGDHQGGLPTAQGTPTGGQCNGAHCSCGYSLCGWSIHTYIRTYVRTYGGIHTYICMYMWVSGCVVWCG